MTKLSEDAIQKALMQYVRLQWYAPYVFHIPNEAPRTPRYGAKMKAMGLMPGASDLFVARPSGEYHGMFLELKREGGRLTKYQKEFLERMSDAGYATSVCYTIDEAIESLVTYFKQGSEK